MERSEVVARRARKKAQMANYYRNRLGLPGLPLPPLPTLDPDDMDMIPEAEALARIAEVSRVKRGLKRLGIKPRLTPSELERVLP